MWSRKSQVNPAPAPSIRIVMPKLAMTTVFDECDHFTEDETGGRVIGTYHEDRSGLTIKVGGIIEPGPSAKRSRVSFFQDGAYQEQVFRKVEERHPEIEHLGNWHTHHVNGYPQLSGGDIETYTRTVNHPRHNVNFFYALLVTAKNKRASELGRYDFKHYVFRRGVPGFVEIFADQVEFVENDLAWPVAESPASNGQSSATTASEWYGRVADRDVLSELFENFKSFTSPQIGFYWRGKLALADGTSVDAVVIENQLSEAPTYGVMMPDAAASIKRAVDQIQAAEFPSARQALVSTERVLNRALFKQSGRMRR